MKTFSLWALSAAFVLFLAPGVHAFTVSTQDCSAIDTADGNSEDWAEIPYLIDSDAEDLEGTLYYLDSDTEEWSTTEPDNYRYTMNMDEWADIKKMKVCNTADDFFLMLQNASPMMTYYDTDDELYYDLWYYNNGSGMSVPASFEYWMVWKMQEANGEGSIVYFAADLRFEDAQDLDENFPALFIYEESVDVSFDDATFNPNTDTLLTEVEVTNEETTDCDPLVDDGCENVGGLARDQAFEVRQDIADLFDYADFTYGDTIAMTASMYHDDDFTTSSVRFGAATDTSDTGEFTFSKRGVRQLSAVDGSETDTSIRLKWKSFKGAASYQIKLIDTDDGTVVRKVTGIKKNKKTLNNLESGTTYRAIVRARKSNGKKSAWSSGYRWTL